MFYTNPNLTEIPAKLLPFTTLKNGCYSRMFMNTGITKIPSNFLPAANALDAYSFMFYGSKVSYIEEGAIQATAARSMSRMFMASHLEQIKDGAFQTISSNANGTFYQLFSGCKFETIPTALKLDGTGNAAYSSMFENNKKLQTVEDFFNIITIPSGSIQVLASVFSGCTGITSVSIPYTQDEVHNKPELFDATFDGCTSLNKVEVKFTDWTYIDKKGVEQPITVNWLRKVSTEGTFYCPQSLIDKTDGYYDETGTFIQGVGRSASTVPAGWQMIPNDDNV